MESSHIIQEKIKTLGIRTPRALATFLLSNLAHARIMPYTEETHDKFCLQLDLKKTFGLTPADKENDNLRLFEEASLLLNNALAASQKSVTFTIEGHYATLEVLGRKFNPEDLGQVMHHLKESADLMKENEAANENKTSIKLALNKIKDLELL